MNINPFIALFLLSISNAYAADPSDPTAFFPLDNKDSLGSKRNKAEESVSLSSPAEGGTLLQPRPRIKPIPRHSGRTSINVYEQVVKAGEGASAQKIFGNIKEKARKSSTLVLHCQGVQIQPTLQGVTKALPKNITTFIPVIDAPSPSFFKGLQPLRLKKLYFSHSFDFTGNGKEKFRALSRLHHLEALNLGPIRDVSSPLPRNLKTLVINGSARKIAHQSLKPLFRPLRNLESLTFIFRYTAEQPSIPPLLSLLPKLKRLKIESSQLSRKDLERILKLTPYKRKPPLKSLSFWMTLIDFQPLSHYLHEGGSLKYLRISKWKIKTLPPRIFTPEEFALNRQALHHILSQVKGLSLSPCCDLLELFQGAENLLSLSIEKLKLKHDDLSDQPLTPPQIQGFLRGVELKSLQRLVLSGPNLFQRLLKADPENFPQIGDLHFKSFGLDVSSHFSQRHLEVFPSFLRFIESIFHKAPLATFSLSCTARGCLSEKEEEALLKILPPEHKSLQRLEIEGIFRQNTWKTFFSHPLARSLKCFHFKNPEVRTKEAIFCPKNLFDFLTFLIPQEVIQEKGAPQTEKEAQRMLRIPDEIEISFRLNGK